MGEFLSRNKSAIFFVVCAIVFMVVVWKSVTPGEDAEAPQNTVEGERAGAAVVQEVHDIGNYTILKLALGAREGIWVASPPLEAHLGDMIVVENQALMQNFYSSTLDRTFEEIYFVDAAYVVDKDRNIIRSSQQQPASQGPPNMPGAETQTADVTPVDPPAGGMTIAQLNATYGEHADQEVQIRGTVVKANPGILGTNWYHLQDGSAAGPAGDVIVTSNDEFERGELVTVTGVVELNQEKGEFMSHEFAVKATTVVREQAPSDNETPKETP